MSNEHPKWDLSPAELDDFMESLPVSVLHWDSGRDPVHLSNSAARLIADVPPESPFPVRGSGMGGYAEPYRSQILAALRAGQPYDGIVHFTTVGGETRVFDLHVRGNSERGWAISAPSVGSEGAPIPPAVAGRFTRLFARSNVGMLLISGDDGRIVTANEAAARLLGRASVAELLPRGLFARDVLADDAAREALIQELDRDGFVSGRELPFVRPDGSERWVRLDLALNDEDRLIEVVLADVHQERLARLALEARERRFRTMFEGGLTGMYLVRITDASFVDANQRLAEILGYRSVAELRDRWETDFPGLREDLAREFRETVASGSTSFVRYRALHRPDGSLRYARSQIGLHLAEGLAEAIVMDVTSEFEAQHALEESERHYRGLFENAVVGMVTARLDGALISANREAARIFGHASEEDLVQRWGTDHAATQQQFHDAIEGIIASGATTGTVECDALWGERPELRLRTYHHVHAEEGTADIVLLDTTAQHLADLERERLIAALERQAIERRQLVQRLLRAGEEERQQAAHEMHDGPAQLMGGAAMFLHLADEQLAEGDIDRARQTLGQGAGYLKTALEETRRIMARLRPAILDDLGLIAAIESAATTAVEPFGMSVSIGERGEPSPLDEAVETVMYRVAQEAATNAGKHSGGTNVTITLDFEDPAEVRMVVQDDGAGFDTAETFRSTNGHHLGLLGMRERAELISGSLIVQSAPGQGTRVEVRVPRGARAVER